MKYVLLMIGIALALFGFFVTLGTIIARSTGESESSLTEDIVGAIIFGVSPLVSGSALCIYAKKSWNKATVQPLMCSNCKHLVDPGLVTCPYCGDPLSRQCGAHGRYPATGGQTPNKELMRQAREALSGHWGLAVGTFLVGGLISAVPGCIPYPSRYVGQVVSLVLQGPLEVGASVFALALSRKEEAKFGQLFHGFKRFGVSLGAYLLATSIILLWSLLLIVPGIIAAISYSQAFFIIADNDSVGVREALRKSQEMMRGHKWKYLCLELRFLGWVLLCLFTYGIALLWVWPYMMVSFARFYDDIAEVKQ